MKCEVAEQWLLAERADSALPTDVRHHLAECSACLHQRSLLRKLDWLSRELPIPNGRSQVLTDLWKRLEPIAMPTQTDWPLPYRRRRDQAFRYRRFIILATAACLLILPGILIGRFLIAPVEKPPKVTTAVVDPKEKPREKQRPLIPAPAQPMIIRLANHNATLATAQTPVDRVDGLARMANEVRSEALLHVRQGSMMDVPRLVQLYQILLRDGLTVRALALGPKERPTVVERLISDLKSAASQVDTEAAESLPAVGDLVRPMAVASRRAADNLSNGKAEPMPIPGTVDEESLTQLVRMAIKLANEPDSLRRAATSAELAELLARSIALCSATEDIAYIDDLGESLASVVGGGIGDNLDQAVSDDWTGERSNEIEQVRLRAKRASEVLEANLAKAPPSSVPGLQRALDVSQKGLDRPSKGKGKGKGSTFIPPGQLKKMNKESDR